MSVRGVPAGFSSKRNLGEASRRNAAKLLCGACRRRAALRAVQPDGTRTCRYCGAVTGPQGPQKGHDDGTPKEG